MKKFFRHSGSAIVFCLLLSLVPIGVFDNCARASTVQTPELKVGFIMCGSVTDRGWNQAHNEGRLYLEKNMKGKVQTTFAENVPENAEAARLMEKMISQGVKVIFATSYGYLESVLKVASHHPDIIFMQSNRKNNQITKNVGVYFLYSYEPFYVSGLVAGRMTKTNKIGFIVGHTVPSVMIGVNAFTLGMRSVNPKAVVRLVCTNSWYDPTIESEATKALIDSDCDIVTSNLSSAVAICTVAQHANVYCVGIHTDLNKQIPNAWLTGQIWNRGPLYLKIIREILNGVWVPATTYYTIKDGYTSLASFGKAVPKKVQREALTTLKEIKDGKLVIFKGPLSDRDGLLRISAGTIADNKTLEQMNWGVTGIEGSISK